MASSEMIVADRMVNGVSSFSLLAIPFFVLSGILMGRVVLNGTTQPVTAADFGGKMVQYNHLLAELLRWNLGDFFDWLRDAHAEEKRRLAGGAAQ